MDVLPQALYVAPGIGGFDLKSEFGFCNLEEPEAVYVAVDSTTHDMGEWLEAHWTQKHSQEVAVFVKEHNLDALLCESEYQLTLVFGILPPLRYRIYTNAQDGSRMLLVEVPVRDLLAGDEKLTEFAFDWCYDHIGESVSVVGFRVVKAVGV